MLLNEVFAESYEGELDIHIPHIESKPYSLFVDQDDPQSEYNKNFSIQSDDSDGVIVHLNFGEPVFNQDTGKWYRKYVKPQNFVDVEILDSKNQQILSLIPIIRRTLEKIANLDSDQQQTQIYQLFKSIINKLNLSR